MSTPSHSSQNVHQSGAPNPPPQASSTGSSKRLKEDTVFYRPGLRTAVLVDGAFFLKRLSNFCRKQSSPQPLPAKAAQILQWLAYKHVEPGFLYRILVYDCKPLDIIVNHPLTNAKLDFSSTTQSQFRLAFHQELIRSRKVALRLGRLATSKEWEIDPKLIKGLLSGALQVQQLTQRDIKLCIRQKGVDMKIGLDIASLAYKGLVDQIILIAGDADFVPAAKLARREGIDIILDPMGAYISDDLHEHIDGLNSFHHELAARYLSPSLKPKAPTGRATSPPPGSSPP